MTPIFLTSLSAGADWTVGSRPAMASAWMSANSIVFYGLWMPMDLVEDVAPARLAGDAVRSMMQIWPTSEPRSWPADYIADDEAFTLIDLLASIRNAVGMKVDELSDDELERLRSQLRQRAADDRINQRYAFVQRNILHRPSGSRGA